MVRARTLKSWCIVQLADNATQQIQDTRRKSPDVQQLSRYAQRIRSTWYVQRMIKSEDMNTELCSPMLEIRGPYWVSRAVRSHCLSTTSRKTRVCRACSLCFTHISDTSQARRQEFVPLEVSSTLVVSTATSHCPALLETSNSRRARTSHLSSRSLPPFPRLLSMISRTTTSSLSSLVTVSDQIY